MARHINDLRLTPTSQTTKDAIGAFLVKLQKDNFKSLATAKVMAKATPGFMYDGQVKYHENVDGFIRNALAQNDRRRIRKRTNG